jgi:hypothetical protein
MTTVAGMASGFQREQADQGFHCDDRRILGERLLGMARKRADVGGDLVDRPAVASVRPASFFLRRSSSAGQMASKRL